MEVKPHVELVLGGARSGKSGYAERQAKMSNKAVIYIATAEVGDKEMAERVKHHQQQRPAEWKLIEEPFQLAQSLKENSTKDNCILVDCLTLWLSNCLFSATEKGWHEWKSEFLTTLNSLPGQVILVSNEVGCGVVPMGEVSRKFVDEAGWLHQSIAAQVAKVTLVTAGLPIHLKDDKEKV